MAAAGPAPPPRRGPGARPGGGAGRSDLRAGRARAGGRADAAPRGPQLGRRGEPGQMQELLKQRASFELKLQTEAQARKEVDAALAKEREDHRNAIESLTFQQQKLRALQEER